MAVLQQYHLHLTPETPHPTVEQAYGLLLHLLGPAPDHMSGANKPLSLARVPSSADAACFQVGVLTAPLAAAFAPLVSERDRQVPFGSAAAVLHAVRPVHPEPVPYQALFDQTTVPHQIGLRFLTPTCFRHQGENLLFPDPSTLFGSLLSRFNACSPFPFPEDVLDALRPLQVIHYRLQTRTVQFPTHRVTGFTGVATYRLPPNCPPQIAYLAAALLRFACYSGAGSRTHLGLGHVALLEER